MITLVIISLTIRNIINNCFVIQIIFIYIFFFKNFFYKFNLIFFIYNIKRLNHMIFKSFLYYLILRSGVGGHKNPVSSAEKENSPCPR